VWGGGRVHAILRRHLTDAKGRLKRQILKNVQMLVRMGCRPLASEKSEQGCQIDVKRVKHVSET